MWINLSVSQQLEISSQRVKWFSPERVFFFFLSSLFITCWSVSYKLGPGKLFVIFHIDTPLCLVLLLSPITALFSLYLPLLQPFSPSLTLLLPLRLLTLSCPPSFPPSLHPSHSPSLPPSCPGDCIISALQAVNCTLRVSPGLQIGAVRARRLSQKGRGKLVLHAGRYLSHVMALCRRIETCRYLPANILPHR